MTDASPSPSRPDEPPPAERGLSEDLEHPVETARNEVGRLEGLVGPELRAALGLPAAQRHPPGWMRSAPGEERWPVALAVAVAIVLEVALPDRLIIGPGWLLPTLEGALAVGLIVANPRHIDRRSNALRAASVGLIAVISLANGWSVYELIRGLVDGTVGKHAGPLLSSGASIYVNNIIVFALWYWDWDRGGPVERALGSSPYPDFLFPQMTQDHLAPDDWRPTFLDYLYVSYTNATAFSPTDTMPLSRWSKLLMLLQSAVSLVTVALVIARAVNILP